MIDSTNPKKDKRAAYVNLAKELDVPVRCIHFTTEKAICLKNNKMREVNDHRKHWSGKVPSIAIHVFFKYLVAPDLCPENGKSSEGFDEVIRVNFVPQFVNKKDEETWRNF